jgi:adenylyltransferase/sulfurtransferase
MENEWRRYSCQIALPGFGVTAQRQLQAAKVLIVGAGGLGCPAAQYLAAAGVGTIAIADHDVVGTTNLHRQVLYSPGETGQPKALVACEKLGVQNPEIRLVPLQLKITSENVMAIVEPYDIVVDGTDNFETKYLLNDACVLLDKPLVYGAIYQFEGQVAVWNVANADGSRSPNYRDLFPDVNEAAVSNCADGGVLPTIAGMIGCMQATEVIKYITHTGELLAGKLFVLDAATGQSRLITIGHRTHTEIRQIEKSMHVPAMTAQELKKAIDRGSVDLIDVRNAEERNRFHIGGEHIPLDHLDPALFLQRHRPTVFYCASGERSAGAVRMIKKDAETAEVFSLAGGLKAWQEMG